MLKQRKLYTLCIGALITLGASTAVAQENFSEAFALYNEAVAAENSVKQVEFAQTALALGSEKFGTASENTANLKYNLALAYIANQQAPEAFDTLGEVIEDYKLLFGENSQKIFQATVEQISTARIYENKYKGDSKAQRKALKKVQRDYRDAIKIAEQLLDNLAAVHPNNVGLAYYQLASVLNRGPLANNFFKVVHRINLEAEKQLINQFGEADARVIETQFMLAKFFRAKKNTNKSIDYFEKVVAQVQKQLNTSHPFELAAHASLVELYESTGKSTQATEHCLAIGTMTPWSDDIDPSPLYRKNPKYPENEARRKNDGWVSLEFVIDSFGFVKDIKVIETTSDSFAKEGVKALEKWRYAPKISDGQAVVSPKMKVRLDFKIS